MHDTRNSVRINARTHRLLVIAIVVSMNSYIRMLALLSLSLYIYIQACTYLPSREEYVAQLEAAGFKVEDFEDVTSEWAAFTKERLNIFDSKRERHNDVHGPELVERLAHFYTATSEILAGGGVGGARILCTAI